MMWKGGFGCPCRRYQQEHHSYRIDVQQNRETREAVRRMFTGPTAAVGSVLEVYSCSAEGAGSGSGGGRQEEQQAAGEE